MRGKGAELFFYKAYSSQLCQIFCTSSSSSMMSMSFSIRNLRFLGVIKENTGKIPLFKFDEKSCFSTNSVIPSQQLAQFTDSIALFRPIFKPSAMTYDSMSDLLFSIQHKLFSISLNRSKASTFINYPPELSTSWWILSILNILRVSFKFFVYFSAQITKGFQLYKYQFCQIIFDFWVIIPDLQRF